MSARVVIGVGNAYRGDDGVGLAVAERLRGRVAGRRRRGRRASRSRPGCSTPGRARRSALVVDAVVSGAGPGTVHRFDASDEPLPARVFRSSTHAFGVGDAIELARALGRLPGRVVVYGVEGADFAAGEGLTPPSRRPSSAPSGGARGPGALARRRSRARARADARPDARSIDEVARAEGADARDARRACASARSRTSRRSTSASTSRTRRAGTVAEGAEVDAVARRRPRPARARRTSCSRASRSRAASGGGALMCLGSIARARRGLGRRRRARRAARRRSRRLARLRARRRGRRRICSSTSAFPVEVLEPAAARGGARPARRDTGGPEPCAAVHAATRASGSRSPS